MHIRRSFKVERNWYLDVLGLETYCFPERIMEELVLVNHSFFNMVTCTFKYKLVTIKT